ncbi:hypothetical protein AVEN_237608-1 [Araneus ventricosus]|uniref:Uncharacterized protein n=1 Tax=Araneus ventricosus TaxID=182803 RepID=A0A4Y2ENQ4_ARAVE|nr:hypothetical protein AVEN_237608-1 [Araneus ventricosus]
MIKFLYLKRTSLVGNWYKRTERMYCHDNSSSFGARNSIRAEDTYKTSKDKGCEAYLPKSLKHCSPNLSSTDQRPNKNDQNDCQMIQTSHQKRTSLVGNWCKRTGRM